MFNRLYTSVVTGIKSQLVSVEVDISLGLLHWHIVGLPDIAIKESKQRIAAALKNSGIKIPDRKVTINLAPADLKKEGAGFDLPIAIALLNAFGLVSLSPQFIEETLWVGELALDGKVCPVRGILAIVADAHQMGKKRVIIPEANFQEAALIDSIEVIGTKDLKELVEYLQGVGIILNQKIEQTDKEMQHLDFQDVQGQEQAKRGLCIAAAGGHNLMMIGSPGSGKTMLAERLSSIMPDLTYAEQIEVTKIYSAAGLLQKGFFYKRRPFRSPHHTISFAGLIGGGSIPQPGEISFAHKGILFLDELLEFKRPILELLRQPLESRKITITRAQATVEYPASFLLLAAMNPCPCGYFGDARKPCTCSHMAIQNYLSKLSGPLIDRIDLQVGVHSIAYDQLQSKTSGLSSADLKIQVDRARKVQLERFGSAEKMNACMSTVEIEKYCITNKGAELTLKMMFDRLALSLRGYHKLLKVARTIADMQEASIIDENHIYEALSYRALDTLLENKKR